MKCDRKWLFCVFILAGVFPWAGAQEAFCQPSLRTVERSGTIYLDDPELLREEPIVLPRPSPSPTPSATASPSPTPKPRPIYTPQPRLDPDEEDLLLRQARRFRTLAPSGSTLVSIQAPAAGGTLFVGQTIPVPTDFAPPQVIVQTQNPLGAAVVVPATPTRFAPVPSGITWGPQGFQAQELSGFIDYGNPFSGPILMPVFRQWSYQTEVLPLNRPREPRRGNPPKPTAP